MRKKTDKLTPILRLRLIPVTMLMAMVLFGMKINDVVKDGRNLSEAITFSEATAAQDAFAEETEEKVAEEQATDSPVEGEEDGSPHGDAASVQEGEGGPEKISVSSDKKPEHVEVDKDKPKRQFTQIEIDLLQSLSQRREEIDAWEKELEMRSNILAATEQRIEDKIAEMKGLKSEVEALMAQYNEQEDAKIRSLVKIYESMKPKDAARIFDEVDMPVLLMVIDRMSEKKVAPVLAKMSAKKAKEVTIQLAEQRKLQKNMAESVQALK